jgi:hypothetical protein
MAMTLCEKAGPKRQGTLREHDIQALSNFTAASGQTQALRRINSLLNVSRHYMRVRQQYRN